MRMNIFPKNSQLSLGSMRSSLIIFKFPNSDLYSPLPFCSIHFLLPFLVQGNSSSATIFSKKIHLALLKFYPSFLKIFYLRIYALFVPLFLYFIFNLSCRSCHDKLKRNFLLFLLEISCLIEILADGHVHFIPFHTAWLQKISICCEWNNFKKVGSGTEFYEKGSELSNKG